MSVSTIQALAAAVAEYKGFRLLHLEVPRDVYDNLMAEHKALRAAGEHVVPPPPETPFKVCGVQISKAEAPVSDGMRHTGARILRSHKAMDDDEMVARIYRAMVEQQELERPNAQPWRTNL